ncbi:MAG: NAD(P)H-dependent oxidoreductase [Actinomycetota bacterium]
MSHTILAISGSLRSGSSNTGLIRLAERIAEAEPNLDLRIVAVDDIDSLPFYNADLEDPELTPSSVRDWRARVDDCAGLFIASPEYNFGPTALLKNAIDWVSRPPGQHVLRHKAISLMSSSASTGGKHMTEQLTKILTLLGNTVIDSPEALFVKGAERIFSDGTTSDPAVEEVVRARLSGLAEQLRSA